VIVMHSALVVVNPSPRRLGRDLLDLALLCLCLLGLVVFAVHGPYGAGDIKLYHRYAMAFWTGAHAFHRLPLEYPPPALLAFSLTLLPPAGDFATVFALWMAAAFLAGYFAFRRFSSRHNAAVYAVYLLVGATGGLLGRFDLLPSLLTVGALWACRRRRYPLAYLLLALGGMLKLYPLALLPLVMIEHRRHLLRSGLDWWRAPALGAGSAVALVGAGFGAAFLLAGGGAFATFTYAAGRPLQVESLGATLLWFGSFLGFPAVTEHGWSSYNLVGPLDLGLIALTTAAGIAGLGWVYLLAWRGRLSLARAFLAVVCVMLLGSKVFSPQYLIWALPLVVEAEGTSVLWLAICACTTLIFPVIYVNDHIFGTPGPLPYSGTFLGAIAVRNLLLLGATARLLLPWPLRLPDRSPAVLEGSLSVTGD
jgi:hypothetical protein